MLKAAESIFQNPQSKIANDYQIVSRRSSIDNDKILTLIQK